MIAYYHAVREAATRIAAAADHTVQALRDRRIEHEPDMTSRMIGAIEESLHDVTIRGIRWTAKALTDRGPGAQESAFGADLLGVANIDLPEFHVSKGFLAQAKLIRHGRVDERQKLRQQCEQMLRMTPDSFVFLYRYDGIRVVPAISVLAADVDPISLYSRSCQRFFEEHLECFIGDGAIQSATPAALEALRRRFEVRNALLIRGESEDLRANLRGNFVE